MEVTATKKGVSGESKLYVLPSGSKVEDLIEEAGMYVDVTISIRNDELVPSDENLKEGDHITLINVSSGG